RSRAAGRGPRQGGGPLLAGPGRQGRYGPRVGHRQRDRCGPWRHHRGATGTRRRSAGAVFAAVGRCGVMLSRRALLFATAVLAAGCVGSSPGGRVRGAAGERGGLYLAFAELVAKQLKARYPDMAVEAVPTEGSIDNLARMRSGEADMGLALADVAERDRASGPAGTAPLAVARVYENYLQVIVPDSGPVLQLEDLQGLRISIGPGGSGAAATSEVLLEAAGLRGRVDTVRYRLRDGLAGLANGSLDALVWSGGVPTPALSDLHAKLPLR